MKSSRYHGLAIIAALVGLLVAAPAQAAPPLKRGLSDFALPYENTPTPAPTLKRGLSDFGLRFEYVLPATESAAADERIVVDRTDNVSPAGRSSVGGEVAEPVNTPFSWQNAGIGAGAALLLVGALGLIVLRMRHTRRSVALP
jgi:hypothetical protein